MNYSSAPLEVNGNLYSIVILIDDVKGTESVRAHDIEGHIVLSVDTADSGHQTMTVYCPVFDFKDQLQINFNPTDTVDGMRNLINLFIR